MPKATGRRALSEVPDRLVGPGARRFAKSTAIGAGITSVLSPNISIKDAIVANAAGVGGENVARNIARRLRGGGRAQLLAGLAGGIGAYSAMRSRQEKKEDERARKRIFEKKGASARTRLTPQSSNVKGYSYNSKTQSLTVTFKNGGTYEYKGVPRNIIRSLNRNKSVGKTLHKRVKGGGFEYQKLGAEVIDIVKAPVELVGNTLEEYEEPLSLGLGTAIGSASMAPLGVALGGRRGVKEIAKIVKHPNPNAGVIRKVVHAIRNLPKGDAVRKRVIKNLAKGGILGGLLGAGAGGLFGYQVAKGHRRHKDMDRRITKLQRAVAELKKEGSDTTTLELRSPGEIALAMAALQLAPVAGAAAVLGTAAVTEGVKKRLAERRYQRKLREASPARRVLMRVRRGAARAAARALPYAIPAAGLAGMTALAVRKRGRKDTEKTAGEIVKVAVHTASVPGGGTVDVEKLWALTKGRPIRSMKPEKAAKFPRSRRTGFGPKRLAKADTKYPVMLLEDGYIIDGRHRVAKLQEAGKRIRYVTVTKADLRRAMIKEASGSNLFDNIRAKRARGEKPAKPGDKDYPKQRVWKKVTKQAAVVLRKEHRNPKGGLTAKGRAAYNKATGSNLKPGVRGKANTPEKMRRKGSFLTRMFGPGAKGPMVRPNGKPSRRALSAAAWGEPVPKDEAGRARLYAKGQSLLKQYGMSKKAAPGDSVSPHYGGQGNVDLEASKELRDNDAPKIRCSACGWTWRRNESEPNDMYNCHKCGAKNSGVMTKRASAETRRRLMKLAGQAKKQVTYNGLTMKLELLAGDTRFKGTSGEVKMKDHYGYLPGTYGKGHDGDAIDVYVNTTPKGDKVFRVTQIDTRKNKLDEYKYMVGYGSRSEAEKAYKRNRPGNMPPAAYGGIKAVSMNSFRRLAGQKEKSK